MRAMNGIVFEDSLEFGDPRIGDQFPTKAEADLMNLKMGKWLESMGCQNQPLRVVIAKSIRDAKRRKTTV
jgi:hypothetical protein